MSSLFLFCQNCFCEDIFGKVVAVVDGDTVKILENNKELKIRMLNIDAPEKKQPFGSRAKQRLSEKIFNKDVKVEYKGKDKYQRILGTIWIDNKNINLEMVEEGYAWAYRKYLNDISYLKAEDKAKSNKVGLWTDPNPIPPWNFRKSK